MLPLGAAGDVGDLNPRCLQLVADTVGLGEVLRLLRLGAGADLRFNVGVLLAGLADDGEAARVVARLDLRSDGGIVAAILAEDGIRTGRRLFRGIALADLRGPSVVAIDKNDERILAVGIEAKRMLGRTPGNIVAVRPLKDGVIADFDVTEAMLRYFIDKASEKRYPWTPRPRVVVCVPSGVTSVEKRAVFEATIQAGARQAYLIEEPMAAAIGADLPVEEPTGSMVIDIGGGTTEVAVIAMGGIVVSRSIRVAGDEFDQAILSHVRDAYNLAIGERTAEDIKIKVGSAVPLKDELDVEVNGRDVITGLPKTVRIESEEIRRALQKPLGPLWAEGDFCSR